MLKNEENAKYRATIKNTLEFDPEVLKRFVNFMNNPDEETAVAQFGKGDKYFGIATLLVTMPGLPMFGHGQIEGFEEKYGMEYRRSYRDEKPDQRLVDRHEREIFPLMKKRHIYSGSANFCLYDLHTPQGEINENVFAYSNSAGDERSLALYNNAYPEAGGWIHQSAAAIPQKSGGFRRDSLCQALGFHGSSARFALLREQRQDLWYIRSSKEIAERGLFVSLKGYEAQVFIDIHEVEDDRRGRYARLHAELNGRGVRDVQAAIQDIYLGELYYRFAELFSRDHLDRLFPREKTAGPPPEGAAVTAATGVSGPEDSLRDAVLSFVNAAEKFLDGAFYDPFVAEQSYEKIPGEQVWQEFAACLERLRAVTKYGAAAPHKGDSPAIRFLHRLGEKLNARPALIVFAYAYGALSLLRSILGAGAPGAEAKALGDHWALDRKLRELFGAYEVSGDEANRVLEIMKAVLTRTSPGSAASKQKTAVTSPPIIAVQDLSPAEKLVLDNYHAEDFRKLLGVNIFEGVIWFNKESFEETLFYAPLFAALESAEVLAPGAAPTAEWLDRIAGIADIAEAFAEAEGKSGYQLDELLRALGTGDSGTSDPRNLRSQAKPRGKKS
jgi:hypothetical protein